MKCTLMILIAGAALVSAADRPAKRQVAQQKRIAEGAQSGELTKKEVVKIEKKEAQLHREIVRDRIDGPGLTPAERGKIEKKQDKLSKQIAKEKHDAQKR